VRHFRHQYWLTDNAEPNAANCSVSDSLQNGHCTDSGITVLGIGFPSPLDFGRGGS
jgi:hypothetical protein